MVPEHRCASPRASLDSAVLHRQASLSLSVFSLVTLQEALAKAAGVDSDPVLKLAQVVKTVQAISEDNDAHCRQELLRLNAR